MTVEINFAVDFTDPTRYTLISGLPLASFGNPSPALYGKPAKIELRLPLPGTLTFVAADFTRKQNSSLNARCDVIVDRAVGSKASYTRVTNCPGLGPCPFLRLAYGDTITNVIKISYEAYSPNAFGTKFEAWLDNCAARVTFDTNAIISTIQGKVGVTFTGACISGERLYEIVSALQGFDATQVDAMLGLIGMYPELEAPLRQRKLNESFTAVKTALQTTPASYPQTELDNYKTAIQEAFGVTLSEESGAQVWGQPDRGGIALHFARLGLEAVADAFERWVSAQVAAQELCYTVNKFALFQRVMGQMTLRNIMAEADNVAITDTPNRTISINRVPNGDRQWVMTPNNLIHEFGHYLSRAAGFEFPKLGSIEATLDPFLAGYSLASRYDREGLGPLFLRQQIIPGDFSTLYYVHATIDPDGSNPNVAAFTPITTDPVLADDYLLYDLFEDSYPLWNSALNIYPPSGGKPAARVDLFVQNYPLLPGPEPRDADDVGFDFTRRAEITADAFLNWVRTQFDASAKGQAWLSYFEDANQRIGMFLRNAVIRQIGMIAYYEPIIFPPSPHREIRSGTFQVRLAPIIDPSTSIGKAYDESDPDNDLNLQFTRTYGWTVNDGEEWFLIEYPDGRLMWITVAAVIFDPQVDTDKDPSRQISDPLRLSPGRAYSNDVTNHDLLTILGVEVTA